MLARRAQAQRVAYLVWWSLRPCRIEAFIGFLGLGDPNTVSWGQLAGEAQRFLRIECYPQNMNVLRPSATSVSISVS